MGVNVCRNGLTFEVRAPLFNLGIVVRAGLGRGIADRPKEQIYAMRGSAWQFFLAAIILSQSFPSIGHPGRGDEASMIISSL
jgi:hypothetical protein